MAIAGPPGRQYWGGRFSTSSANHPWSVPPTGSEHRDGFSSGFVLGLRFALPEALRRHFLTRCCGSRLLRPRRCGDLGLVSRHKPAEHHVPMFLQLQALRRHVSRPVAAGVPGRCDVSNASCCGSGSLHLFRRCGVLVASCCGSGSLFVSELAQRNLEMSADVQADPVHFG